MKHALLSISLNSISKWKARVLPSFKDSVANNHGQLPKWLTYSLAALLAFYHTTKAGKGCLLGTRGTDTYEIHDDADKLDFIRQQAGKPNAAYVKAIMSRTDFWGEDLTKIPGFYDAVVKYLDAILSKGALAVIQDLGKK